MEKRVIAVGFFDGVHKGHKALMNRVLEVSKEKNLVSAVFTFKQHPDTVVFNKNVPLICSNSCRESVIKKYGGVSDVFFWDFDLFHSKMPWDVFVTNILVNQLGACHIVTGADFKFGYKGMGNCENLSALCKKLGIGYDAIPQIMVNNKRVSSTIIRQHIENGEIEQANYYLGHPYTITGYVEHGRKVGRTIGIPTINISMPDEMQSPCNGVYITRVIIDNKKYMATTNVGTVPTFLSTDIVKVEPHILDFSGNVYDKYVEVEFLQFLRLEKKFDSIDDLKHTILQNIEQTRQYFKENQL